MDYDSDGILRAEWPNSGHFELTPMLWTTMHWTRFVKPGWRALPCTDASVPTGRCALAGGGNCECCMICLYPASRAESSQPLLFQAFVALPHVTHEHVASGHLSHLIDCEYLLNHFFKFSFFLL